MGRAPENSLKAWQTALADGADGFECDVVFTRDREPVIMHVPMRSFNVHRQTGYRLFLDRIDWKDLCRYKTLGEPIVHLDELLQFLSQNQISCVIEPKRTDRLLVEKIVAGVKKFHVEDKVEMIGFYSRRENLIWAKRLLPSMRTSVITLWPFGDWPELCRTARADAIVAGWKFANHWLTADKLLRHLKEKIGAAQAAGIEVHLGLANSETDIKWAFDQCPDRIYSDDIRFLKQILKNHVHS